MMYDVIVIGAGPTGSTASKILSEKGYKVLLVEKFKMPRYKSCSGQLIKKSLNLVKLYFGEEAPDSVTCIPKQNRGMILTNDKEMSVCYEQEGLNVWRNSFDKWLCDKAEAAGTEIRDDTTVLDCVENEGIVTVSLKGINKYTESARYVVDCEGAVGYIKRKLLKIEPQYIMTYQTYNEGTIELDPHYFYAYLQQELSEYDAWFNVKDNLLVLGVSLKNFGNVGKYHSRFLKYMEEKHDLHIEKQIKEDRWLMPHIRPGCNIDYGLGRVLFAGEIAGFLNPMGEGVSSGMESGFCVAKAIMENYDDIDGIYADYKNRVSGLREYMRRQWSLVSGMAETFREMK